MKPTPPGWPRMSSSVFYQDAAAAIDFLCRAFGFEVELRIEGEGGCIEHSELRYGEALIMVSSVGGKTGRAEPLPGTSPQSLNGANTQILCLFVDDADAHSQTAAAAGAHIAEGPTASDYGEDYWSDRSYRAVDPEGHHWWFMQRLSTGGVDASPA